MISSTNDEEDKVYIYVINKNMKNVKTFVEINGFNYKDVIHYWTLYGNSIEATNEDKEDNVKIYERTKKILKQKNGFIFTFPRHAITVIELDKI